MEYTALYRRFRPMTFHEILGQEHITRTLRNQVIADRVGHAYLFTGCRGCGKTSSAKVLARAINCLNPHDGEPCNECSICKAALDGSLTDIVEMDAASNNSVDDIRAIRDEVNFLPTVAKYRVYIIDEVHMLSSGAFNALLKTLEEPPKHVKFILATTEPQKLPATILSRCQRFDFKKIPDKDIDTNLEKICKECKIEYTEGAINLIAELSEGAMRDALSILERCAQDGENKIDEEKIKERVGIPKLEYISGIVQNIIEYDAEKALTVTQNVIDEGKDINNLLWEMIKYIRDMLLYKQTKQISNIYNEDDIKIVEKLGNEADSERLLNIIYKLSEINNGTAVKASGIVQNKKSTEPTAKAKGVNFWSNVIDTLKEQRKPILYSNLINTNGVMIDDMTVGIEFPNGLTSFGRSVIERPENMAELKRLVSMECKQDMRIKLIDKNVVETQDVSQASPIDLGIKINMIDE